MPDIKTPAAKPFDRMPNKPKSAIAPKPIVAADPVPSAGPTAAITTAPSPLPVAAPTIVDPVPVTPAPITSEPAAAPAKRNFTKPIPAAAAPAPAALSATALEGSMTMATTAADATAQTTDKVQTLIADAQSRAKDTMEKSTRMYEEMGSFTKGNVEAIMASSRTAASGFEALGQDMAAYGKRSLEQATAAFKSFASVKSPTELFQLQSDYARSAFDGMVAESSRMSEKVLKLAGDVAQPLSSRMAVAAEKIKVGM